MEPIHPFWVGIVLFTGAIVLAWALRQLSAAGAWTQRPYVHIYFLLIGACGLTLGYASLYDPTDR
ncbi:hypothetical protein [Povalibacter sp.]|uniref:hypothetical protein n=1 Tax=Povalibacter sp. TaxID=1962978 RepID=UPI002F4087E9